MEFIDYYQILGVPKTASDAEVKKCLPQVGQKIPSRLNSKQQGSRKKLKVAPETQNGTKVRLKGKGFPVYKQANTFSDLYLTYQVVLPTKLIEREKVLISELAK